MSRRTMDIQGERIGNNRRVYIKPSAGGFLDLMIGAVQAFATNNPGQGWLPCDGQEINRQQYAKLFEKIGTSFGPPSNGNVFKLPAINNNNYFIRGGNALGATQSDAIRASYGGTFWGSWNREGGTGAFKMGGKGPNRRDPYGDQGGFDAKYTFDFSNGGPVADEVRPKNMTLRYYIFAGV